MLNKIPDSRHPNELDSGVPMSKENTFAADQMIKSKGRDQGSPHESMDLGERRRSSVHSTRNGSPSDAEASKRDSTVDMGKMTCASSTDGTGLER